MMSRKYSGTARALLRAARDMTDRTIANRLKALAERCEPRAQRHGLAETAGALAPLTAGYERAGWSNSRPAAWIGRHGMAALEK